MINRKYPKSTSKTQYISNECEYQYHTSTNHIIQYFEGFFEGENVSPVLVKGVEGSSFQGVYINWYRMHMIEKV